jgi:hypothetical protein
MIWEEQVFNLADTKDSSFVGAIGEMIAWKYLRDRRIWAHRIGLWYPYPADYPFRKGEPIYEREGLNGEQVEYLKSRTLHGQRSYDFIGFKRKRLPGGRVGEVENVYLVEVKTAGPAASKSWTERGVKRKIPEDIERAKALGFKVLLILVELFDDWKCTVNCKEL